MPSVVPRFTDNIVVIPPTILRNNLTRTVRGTIDLRTAYAAILFIDIAKGAQASARTTPVTFQARRMISLGNGSTVVHPGGILRTGTVGTYYNTTVSTSATPGSMTIPVASINNFQLGDQCAIWLPGSESTTFEVFNVNRIDSNGLGIDSPLQFPRTNTHVIYNNIDSFPPFQISGGAVWEIIFDIAGETVVADSIVRCIAQRYEGDMTV